MEEEKEEDEEEENEKVMVLFMEIRKANNHLDFCRRMVCSKYHQFTGQLTKTANFTKIK